MIIVVGRIYSDDEKREELIPAAQALVSSSRAEEGCIDYRFFEDTENRNNFVFVEEWESQEALDAHFRTPHIASFMQAAPNLFAAPPDVRFHTIANSKSLGDLGRGPRGSMARGMRRTLVFLLALLIAAPAAMAAKQSLAGHKYKGVTNQDKPVTARVTNDGRLLQLEIDKAGRCNGKRKYSHGVYKKEAPTIKADGTFDYHRVYEKLAPIPGLEEVHSETHSVTGSFSKDGRTVKGRVKTKSKGKTITCTTDSTFRATRVK